LTVEGWRRRVDRLIRKCARIVLLAGYRQHAPSVVDCFGQLQFLRQGDRNAATPVITSNTGGSATAISTSADPRVSEPASARIRATIERFLPRAPHGVAARSSSGEEAGASVRSQLVLCVLPLISILHSERIEIHKSR